MTHGISTSFNPTITEWWESFPPFNMFILKNNSNYGM